MGAISNRLGLLLSVSLLAMASGPGLAFAQDAEAAAPADAPVAPRQVRAEDANTVDDLVVTAQRRETNLQDVPFSITAFGGQQLERERLTDTNALSARLPSAVFNAAADKGFAVIGLRGVRALLSAPAADLPVVYFFDDVYTSGVSSAGSIFFDLDHIEVLRGPQGTLFGRNVTGGAISIISKKPVFDTDWGASVTAGNFGQLGIEGFVNGVILDDKLAGRLSFSHRENDGLFKNNAGPNLQQENVTAIRGQLLFTPTDNFKVNVSTDYLHDTGTSNPAKVTCVTAAGANCHPVSLPPLSNDPFTVDQNNDATYGVRYYGGSVRADWDFGDIGTLTSITAYRRNTNFSHRDPDSTPLSVYYLQSIVNDRQFTQEFRFASPSENRFSYVAGAFFLAQHNYRRDEYNEQGIPGTPYGTSVPTYHFMEISQNANNTSAAIFAEAAFKVTPQWTVSLGGRFTRDQKDGEDYITGTPGNPRFADPTTPGADYPVRVKFGKETWEAFTPRVYVKYEPTDDLNFYGTIAKGFKGGGFSASQNRVVGLQTPFEPEEVINYEVGAKTKLLDRRIQANISIFRQDIENLQVTYFENGASFTRSVGSSRQQGVEFESNYRITSELTAFLNYAYLDARYVKYSTGTADYAGKFMPFAPKNAVSVGARYTRPIGENLELSVAADYAYKTRLALSDPNNVSREVMDRSIWSMWNGSIDLASTSGRWRVSLWGKNLTNDAPVQAAYDFGTFWLTPAERAAGDRGYLTYYANPRTFGVTLSIKQ
jgi:iron complex outermembrane receptor protein